LDYGLHYPCRRTSVYR